LHRHAVTCSALRSRTFFPGHGSLSRGDIELRQHTPERARAQRLRRPAAPARVRRQLSLALAAVASCALFAAPARAGVTLTPDGWTDITPSADTRIVYVSSSLGDDASDGLAEDRPKRTIAAAKALLRHQRPDWLLLRRGDVWQEAIGWWRTSGRSADEPQLVGAWGDDLRRPLLLTGNENGIHTFDGIPSPATIDHVAIVGLAFFPDTYRGMAQRPAGVRWHQPATGLLIEDCRFDGYHTNVLLEAVGGRHADLAVRRSVLVDSFTLNDSNPQGLYAYAIDGLVLEGNLFDHNGWREDFLGADATLFRHNVYVQTGNTDVEVTGNVFANSASHGIQMRSGGVARDNLFVRCSLALLVRGAAEPVPQRTEVTHNVILDGKDIAPGLERGFGISLRGVAGVVEGNVVANNVRGSFPIAIEVVGEGQLVSDVTVVDNVVSDWAAPGPRRAPRRSAQRHIRPG
jgi:hypothetical protein